MNHETGFIFEYRDEEILPGSFQLFKLLPGEAENGILKLERDLEPLWTGGIASNTVDEFVFWLYVKRGIAGGDNFLLRAHPDEIIIYPPNLYDGRNEPGPGFDEDYGLDDD